MYSRFNGRQRCAPLPNKCLTFYEPIDRFSNSMGKHDSIVSRSLSPNWYHLAPSSVQNPQPRQYMENIVAVQLLHVFRFACHFQCAIGNRCKRHMFECFFLISTFLHTIRTYTLKSIESIENANDPQPSKSIIYSNSIECLCNENERKIQIQEIMRA